MNKYAFQQGVGQIVRHGKVLARGFAKVSYGAATAGLMALAVYGFTTIPAEGGYAAVVDFLTAMLSMGVALRCMYAQGCRKKVR